MSMTSLKTASSRSSTHWVSCRKKLRESHALARRGSTTCRFNTISDWCRNSRIAAWEAFLTILPPLNTRMQLRSRRSPKTSSRTSTTTKGRTRCLKNLLKELRKLGLSAGLSTRKLLMDIQAMQSTSNTWRRLTVTIISVLTRRSSGPCGEQDFYLERKENHPQELR